MILLTGPTYLLPPPLLFMHSKFFLPMWHRVSAAMAGHITRNSNPEPEKPEPEKPEHNFGSQATVPEIIMSN